jgi:hypothetical protein
MSAGRVAHHEKPKLGPLGDSGSSPPHHREVERVTMPGTSTELAHLSVARTWPDCNQTRLPAPRLANSGYPMEANHSWDASSSSTSRRKKETPRSGCIFSRVVTASRNTCRPMRSGPDQGTLINTKPVAQRRSRRRVLRRRLRESKGKPPDEPNEIARGKKSQGKKSQGGHSHFSQAGQALSPASAVPADSRARY